MKLLQRSKGCLKDLGFNHFSLNIIIEKWYLHFKYYWNKKVFIYCYILFLHLHSILAKMYNLLWRYGLFTPWQFSMVLIDKGMKAYQIGSAGHVFCFSGYHIDLLIQYIWIRLMTYFCFFLDLYFLLLWYIVFFSTFSSLWTNLLVHSSFNTSVLPSIFRPHFSFFSH